MTGPYRLVLFIDHQNAYRGARDAFFEGGAFHAKGQFHPRQLGERIAGRDVTRRKRQLAQVRIYTGRPSSAKDPKTYGAHMRQCAAWEKQEDVVVIPRSLRYPRDYPRSKPEEKGIDVQLAIDFVMMRHRDEYDVGVMLSTDTDLLPALEATSELAEASGAPLPEVAAWGESRTGRSRLRVPGKDLRCHWLGRQDYEAVADENDYNRKSSS